MKKYSIVGLSLLAASVIITAFVPSKTSSSRVAINGIMTPSTGLNNNIPNQTCRERVAGDPPPICSFTNTGVGFGVSSTDAVVDSDSVSFDKPQYTYSATTAAGID